jgi:hypothetical protein
MRISVSRLLSIALVIEILVVIAGISLYAQGPTPYLMTITESDVGNLVGIREWLYHYIEFPTGKIHAKFALNMTISTLFNYTRPGIDIYLLNETQLNHWEESKLDYILTRSYPNYNFNSQVEPDDYYLVINATNLEVGNSIRVPLDVKVVFENFNYARVWPSLCVVFVGVVAANVNIALMKRRGMFRKIDSFFRSMYVPRASFPGTGTYSRYSIETYERFSKPLSGGLVQLLPALFIVFVVFRISPRVTSPFTSIAWDYVALASITIYSILCLFIPLFFFALLCITPRLADLSFLVSKKLGFLKAIDVSVESRIYMLDLSKIANRKSLFSMSIPLILFAAIIVMIPYSSSQKATIPTILWIAVILMLSYYGLVFSYIKSSSMKEFAFSQLNKGVKRHFSSRLRLHWLVDTAVTALSGLIFFAVIIGIFVSLVSYVFIPVISSSLAVRYDLASLPTVSPAEVFVLLFQVVLIGSLLVWSVFYGITGYIVPELIDRGVRGSFVGLTAFFLTFVTERVLSVIADPYLRIDLTSALLTALIIFVLVWAFEKFYKKMLRRYETKTPMISQTRTQSDSS